MSALGFYTMMSYPVPLRSEFFLYQQNEQKTSSRPLQAFRSRVQPPSERMLMYTALITKRQRIWRYIPGVHSVYIANSITFNALRDGSNIDFFIVTGEGRLRTTKILVACVFWMIRHREKQSTREMRFSADFIVSQDNQDLSRILLYPSDPYLIYWLAHLVPIYYRDFVFYDNIFEENKWIQYYLPGFLFRQTIFLGIDVLIGSVKIKRWCEWCMYSLLGEVCEIVAKYCSLLYIRWKKRRFPVLAPHIFVRGGIYKSYDDKRKRYALQRELYKKTQKIGEK